MNLSEKTEIPFYKKKVFLIIGGLIILGAIGKNFNNNEKKEVSIVENEIVKPQILKEITSYYENPYSKEGYENLKTYYYGVYINLPKDTTGIEKEIMAFLKDKSSNLNVNDVVHLWIFSDSTVIPKSFSGDWSTPKMREKCFGHAVKLSNGNYSYDYDLLGEFKR